MLPGLITYGLYITHNLVYIMVYIILFAVSDCVVRKCIPKYNKSDGEVRGTAF